ncbi:hypothetical protein EU528_14650 [Candidatus Thorarchaeota archaeon]|nr:MAG: hypothetical protein EU528_14650 [Candidatus Thorarchaeota archaeon]
MSWLLIGMGGVVLLAVLIFYFTPNTKNRRGSQTPSKDDTPLAATRLAEETHHGARVGTIQGSGMLEGSGPLTGTLPRHKDKRD